MTMNEIAVAAVIVMIALFAGFTHVRRRAPRVSPAARFTSRREAPDEANLMTALFGAPLRVMSAFSCLLFVVGMGNGVRGSGLVGALHAGLATALVYGIGVALLAVPCAIVGGVTALFLRRTDGARSTPGQPSIRPSP